MKEIVNNVKRGKTGNAIALHYFRKSDFDLKGWVEYVENLSISYGIHFTRADVVGENGIKGNKAIQYKTAKKRFEKFNYEGVDELWFGATPSWDYDDNFESIFIADTSIYEETSTMVLVLDDDIVKFDEEIFQKIVIDLTKFLSPKYGYIFQRPFDKGPSFYAFGIIENSGFNEEEQEMISEWRRTYKNDDGKRYKTGDLRDIYPGNIICSEHLCREISPGVTLKQWIESDSTRGRIENIGEDLFLWWTKKENIENIRESLRSTGIILCI